MRAFIALELPLWFTDQTATLAHELIPHVQGRFVPPENYHITLAFLGNIGEFEAAGAMDAIDRCPFEDGIELTSNGLGIFGRDSDATLWLGIEPSEDLADLAANLRSELDIRGIDYNRASFVPHITLARRAQITSSDLAALPFPEPETATALTLFKSTLDSDGARYKPLYRRESNHPSR